MPAKNAAAANAGDSQIRDEVLYRLNAELWRPSMLNVTVRDGTVDLWGFVTSDDEGAHPQYYTGCRRSCVTQQRTVVHL